MVTLVGLWLSQMLDKDDGGGGFCCAFVVTISNKNCLHFYSQIIMEECEEALVNDVWTNDLWQEG